jgi:hypothetical protein
LGVGERDGGWGVHGRFYFCKWRERWASMGGEYLKKCVDGPVSVPG